MMHQPFIGERFSGDSGSAHYQGPSGERKLAVRRCTSLKEATAFTTSPLLMNTADRAAFGRIEEAVRLTRYGGDCYSYCMLAAGHLDLVVETELKAYDIAALIPIITGAGGIVTTWEGKPAQGGGRIIAAGDPRVHEADQTAQQLGQGHESSWRAGDGIVAAAVAGIGRRPGFSEQADQADRAVSGRRSERHYRARGRSAHVGIDQATGIDRQSRRAGGRARDRCGRESKSR